MSQVLTKARNTIPVSSFGFLVIFLMTMRSICTKHNLKREYQKRPYARQEFHLRWLLRWHILVFLNIFCLLIQIVIFYITKPHHKFSLAMGSLNTTAHHGSVFFCFLKYVASTTTKKSTWMWVFFGKTYFSKYEWILLLSKWYFSLIPDALVF